MARHQNTATSGRSIAVDHVSFRYARAHGLALEDVTLNWGGETVGLLGPNGAGKSTLVKLLVGQLRPSSGSVSVESRRVGYLPQDAGWPGFFTVEELLIYSAWWHRVPRSEWLEHCETALRDVDLTEHRTRKMSTLSGGQRQRALIAQALVHRPELVILDEPTQGLDPEQRIHVRDVLARLPDETTVIIATHIVDDVEHMCDRVAILVGGHLEFDGDTSAFVRLGGDHAIPGRSAMESAYLAVTTAGAPQGDR